MPSRPQRPALRGDALREHILWTAKDVFLEMGFERASMDVVAGRAATSKRTLYTHFGSKESLFMAVAEFVRELHLDRLTIPEDYGVEPLEAVVLFCGRFLEVLIWESVVRSCRMFITEAEHLPAAAASYHDALYGETESRLARYLVSAFGHTERRSAEIATLLLGQAVYPHHLRVLFGVDLPRGELSGAGSISADIDLGPIRAAVGLLLGS